MTLLVARLTTSTEALGEGVELIAIAVAVIGGFSLSGGNDRLAGPMIGTFLLGVALIGPARSSSAASPASTSIPTSLCR